MNEIKLCSAEHAAKIIGGRYHFFDDETRNTYLVRGFLVAWLRHFVQGKLTYFYERDIDKLVNAKIEMYGVTAGRIKLRAFHRHVIQSVRNVDDKVETLYSTKDVANAVASELSNSNDATLKNIAQWLRQHMSEWLSDTDTVYGDGASLKYAFDKSVYDKAVAAANNRFVKEAVPVLTKPSDQETAELDIDTVNIQLCVRGVHFSASYDYCKELLGRVLKNEHIDSVRVNDRFQMSVNQDELADLANQILKHL